MCAKILFLMSNPYTDIYTHIHLIGSFADERAAAKAVDEFMKEHYIDPPLNFLPDGT